MKGITIVLLALYCCLSENRAQEVSQKNQRAFCCPDTCTVANELKAVGEKQAAMVEILGLVETRLETSEKETEELKRLFGGRPQVAFSATLTESHGGNTGPFTTDTPLQYKKLFSNVGNSYNPATGIFTAMVKGMYYFRFSMMNNLSATPNSAVSLMKNDQTLVSVFDGSGSDANDIGSNAVVIPLEVGDNVYVQLLANKLIFDDARHYNSFSGFLLFPM